MGGPPKTFKIREAQEEAVDLILPLAKRLYDFHYGLNLDVNTGN